MSRLLLALLLTLSLWPCLATGGIASAHEQGSPGSPAIGQVGPGQSAALPSLGGLRLLPRLDTGLSRAERDGSGRPDPGSGHARASAGAAPDPARAERADEALRGAGVLLLRYEHLPYFATAPPAR